MNHNVPSPQAALEMHISRLRACTACSQMARPVVSGGPVVSRVILVGQAPGSREPIFQKPFAWTAGKTLFRWFEEACGVPENIFRERIYMAAVCRCFPGKTSAGGDRVPSFAEVEQCSRWLEAECGILHPALVIPVGKLAMNQFIPVERIDTVIGRQFQVNWRGHAFDLIPLPHPSGASPWHRMEPGKTLLEAALQRIGGHAAFREAVGSGSPPVAQVSNLPYRRLPVGRA